MKSIKILLLSAAVALSAAACSSSPSANAVDTGSSQVQDAAPAGTDAAGGMQQ